MHHHEHQFRRKVAQSPERILREGAGTEGLLKSLRVVFFASPFRSVCDGVLHVEFVAVLSARHEYDTAVYNRTMVVWWVGWFRHNNNRTR